MIESARPDPSLRDCIRYYYQVDARLAARTALQLWRHRRTADAVSPIARAAADIVARSKCVSVPECARAVGLGLRQFERRFRHEIGIAPKLYARIARFEAALGHRLAAPETTWTAIAHALHYYDQMHMVHDFNQLSGDSPTGIGGQLDMFVRPEVASRKSIDAPDEGRIGRQVPCRARDDQRAGGRAEARRHFDDDSRGALEWHADGTVGRPSGTTSPEVRACRFRSNSPPACWR